MRIVESGYPPVLGGTILEKRRYARDELDHLRRMLMFEPRGHFDMYGAVLVEPDLPEADIAVLFMHNEGYSTMCGHATLALGRYAVDRGLAARRSPVSTFVLQAPCGPITVHVDVDDDSTGHSRFESVGAFAYTLAERVDVPTFGTVTYDIGYGGAFYGVADAGEFGLDVRTSQASDLVQAASSLTRSLNSSLALHHPDDDDLGFLYGTILTDGRDDEQVSANVCVFADAQVDRSATGSGVTARMALRSARGQVAEGELRVFESITGSQMTGQVIGTERVGRHDAVTVEVGGRSYYTGTATFSAEQDDPFRHGFLIN